MLQCAIVLNLVHYKFCRIHQTLQATLAMAADYAQPAWSMDDLLRAACP